MNRLLHYVLDRIGESPCDSDPNDCTNEIPLSDRCELKRTIVDGLLRTCPEAEGRSHFLQNASAMFRMNFESLGNEYLRFAAKVESPYDDFPLIEEHDKRRIRGKLTEAYAQLDIYRHCCGFSNEHYQFREVRRLDKAIRYTQHAITFFRESLDYIQRNHSDGFASEVLATKAMLISWDAVNESEPEVGGESG